MKNDIFDSLREAISSSGMKQAQLAENTNVPQSTISRFLAGGSISGDNLKAIAEFLGCALLTPAQQTNLPSDFAMIPKVMAKAGAGSSYETQAGVVGYYAFRHSFLDRVHINAAAAEMMDVIGESMTPLIMPGDTVLIDRSDVVPIEGKIFVVGLDDELLVKRLQKTAGGWALISQNPNFMPIQVGPQDESFRIFGRVRWYGRIME